MAHPARRKNKNKKGNTGKKGVTKALSSNRMKKGSIGTNAIYATQKWVNGLKPFELRFPNNVQTFHEMFTRDDAVGSVLNATYTLVEEAFDTYHIKANNKSKDSVAAAELIKHAFENMRGMTLRTFARNASTFNQFGFSIIEKDYRRLKPEEYDGPLPKGVNYEDVWVVDRLPLIPQRSLDAGEPFVITNDGRNIAYVRQNASWFLNSSHAAQYWQPVPSPVKIPRNKFMLMGINSTDSNPMGVSPLEQVWEKWKEKQFYQNYLSVGISKDMAGMPLLEIPQDILDRANTDPNSPEAALVTSMCEDIAAMHAGEQNMMMIPSDPFTDNGQGKAYNVKFLGIDGSGKNFDLQEAIDKCTRSIYQSFGALSLISDESTGGYNKLEGQISIHMYFINRVISIIEEAINKDLIPQMLELSGIKLSYKDLPKFKSGEIDAISLDEISKMIQRVKSVNGFIPTKEIIIETYQKLGYDTDHLEDMSQEELFSLMESGSKGSSRSGDGMKTAGEGTSTSTVGFGGDNNLENTA